MDNDSAKTIKDQWKVDPLEGVTLNDVQKTIVDEALGNTESMRTEKKVSMELENKYSGLFSQCDSMIKGLDPESLKKLLRNVYINENPKWHTERNSLVHIKIVMSRGLQTKDTDLSKAALYHDIAKFDTVSFNKAGWPTSLGHDKAGAEVAKADGCDEMVVYICAKHMVIKGWQAESEGGVLNPGTKFKIFAEAPGVDNNEKAKAFWKLCVFSKMDNMSYDFDANKLEWNNPSYDKWDEECPLKDEFKRSELVEIKAEKAPMLFTSQELMKFGAKGPQIGQINKEISGKTKEEAFEIIKNILGNPDLTMEKVTNKRYVKLFEQFRKGRINEEVMDDLKDDKSIISWLEKNLEEYIDGLSDYGSGYYIIDKLSKLLVIVGLKLGRDKKFLTDYIDDSKFLEDDSKTSYNEYDEGSVEGSISMNGTEIITYKCHSDGYGFGATIDPKNFEKEIIDFIKAMKNPE